MSKHTLCILCMYRREKSKSELSEGGKLPEKELPEEDFERILQGQVLNYQNEGLLPKEDQRSLNDLKTLMSARHLV